MLIEPSITDLTNRTTQVSEDLEVQILTKREATTTVTVRDGQTIVIGGLISDAYELRENKVPILGDIPLLGLLFRSEFEESAKTELLIVLTPHVITSPAEEARVRSLTEGEIDRLSVPQEQKERLRRSRVIPEESQFHRELEPGSKNEQEDDSETEQGDLLIDPGP
jgi:type II secretory pathway component GspD/PulD (secretin)